MDEAMTGGRFSAPVRRGDTVERNTGPWSANVHALLRHFEEVEFPLAPRFLGVAGDRETLSYIAGEPGLYPLTEVLRSDEVLVNVARAIRAVHDASLGLQAPQSDAWQTFVSGPAEIDCIGHNDLGPWNMIFDGTEVVGIIDWDFAAPSNRIWDLCYAAHRFVPLSPPKMAAMFGWESSPDRAARLRLFAESYGGGVTPADILDLAAVRLASHAAKIEREVRRGNPAFDVHRDERHADANRNDLRFVLDHRDELLG